MSEISGIAPLPQGHGTTRAWTSDRAQEPPWSEALVAAMERRFGADRKRIDHALAVLGWAKHLLAFEPGDPRVVYGAAVLHDIGIQEAERRYGSSAGCYQEIEGPPIARGILEGLGVDEDTIVHICRIIANHHSARDIDTPEFRIIWDADWLVNLGAEPEYQDPEVRERAIERVFRTPTGERRAREQFLCEVYPEG